jgi:hypothetical protein
MFFIKKSKEDVNETCINEIVFTYFSYLKSDSMLRTTICGEEISELLRYSICVILKLETKGYSARLEELSKSVCNILRPVINKYNIESKSHEYRQGLLEACVHCMEMSRKKAGV